jgi:hypothetical protein
VRYDRKVQCILGKSQNNTKATAILAYIYEFGGNLTDIPTMTIILTILAALFGVTTFALAILYSKEKQRTKSFDELNKLKSDIATFRQENEQTQKLLTDLKKERTSFENLISQLTASKKALENEMSGLKSKISEAQRNLETIKTQSEAENNRTQKLQQQFELLDKQNKLASEEIKKLIQETAKYKSAKENAEREFGLSNSALTELQSDVAKLKKQKENFDTELSTLNRLIAEKKNSTATIERNVTIVKPQPQEEEQVRNEVKYIGYQPSRNFIQNTKPFSFPFVSMPKPASVIKFPRKLADGRIGIRGYKELDFDVCLKRYFKDFSGLQFHNDRFLFISNNTKPYVPDHVLIDERNNLNLFIDIEIDEPYEGLSRLTTHEQGKDDYRNSYFNDRGWIVIRFAEVQVHQNILGCCKLIAEVIKSVFPSFIIHPDLQSAESLIVVPFWLKLHAEKWAMQRYRETYLGIAQFGTRESFGVDTSELTSNSDDREAEKEVIAEQMEFEFERSDINIINAHIRDNRLKFNQDKHLYFIDDNPNTVSGTTFIHKFFPEFDFEKLAPLVARKRGSSVEDILQEWEDERVKSSNLGTELHKDIEQFFDDDNFRNEKIEFQYFLDLYKTLNHLELYRTEWRIFDDVLMVAGTADAVFKKPDGTFVIFDWKRSKEIKLRGYPDFYTGETQKGFGVCEDIEDCNEQHYCLQLNLYKKILEEHYFGDGIVSEMYFVQLHPNKTNFQLFTVPNMQDKIEEMYLELLTLK